MVSIAVRIVNLKILKKISLPEDMCFLTRPSTPLAMPPRFASPRMPPTRILIGSFFHSMNAESIEMARRMIIDCL